MLIAIFLVTALSTMGAYLLVVRRLENRDHSLAVRRLTGKTAGKNEGQRPGPTLIRMADEVRGRMAARMLEGLRLKLAAERLLETAGMKWGAAGLLHRSVAAFLGGFVLMTLATHNSFLMLALAAGAGAACVPLRFVQFRARQRIAQFEEQFPDCLEFISRSMRAGHAFSVSIEMVAREFSQPLAGEFRRTFEEQNLGQPLEIVLKKLCGRIPSLDTQFFVSAVLLQKRTGGNLAEILDKLAYIIRERFKLRQRVRTISAQGLMSGRILSAIPLGVGALMFFANPQYTRFFVDDPVGHQLVGIALALQIGGYLVIKKIVNIEV